jgi:hypothetical protein
MGRRVVGDLVVNLRLQMAAGHQPLTQRFGTSVKALLVEDAAVPLRVHLVLDRRRRHRAIETDIHARTAFDVQRQVRLVTLDLPFEANARLQEALLHQRFLDLLGFVANDEEIEGMAFLDVEFVAHLGIVLTGVAETASTWATVGRTRC